MEKRLISELAPVELKKVLANNMKLQYAVSEDMLESEMFWVTEQLDTLSADGALSSWSIGQCNRDQHIRVREGKESEFIDNVLAIQGDYCFLPDKDNAYIQETADLIEKWRNVDMYSDEFDDLEEVIEQRIEEIADKIRDQFTHILDGLLDDGIQEDYFLGFYVEERMDSDFYIDEDYVLYENVAYTRSYAG